MISRRVVARFLNQSNWVSDFLMGPGHERAEAALTEIHGDLKDMMDEAKKVEGSLKKNKRPE